MTSPLLYTRDAIEEAKRKYNISDIAARWTSSPPRKSGAEQVALCLFHRERRASMRLNDAEGLYHCFGCGAQGDIVEFVQAYLGVGFIDALKWLGAAELPPVDEAERQKAVQENKRRLVINLREAIGMWASGSAIEHGDPAYTYLRARGIDIALPPSLRFGMLPKRRVRDAEGNDTDEWGPVYPALICGCQNAVGKVVGIQRIFFKNNDPRLGKADCKLSLGQVRGSVLRLAPPEDHVGLIEGPEDGLSAVTLYKPGLPVWVVMGTGMMPYVDFPSMVKRLTLLGQNDEPGRLAVSKASEEYQAKGLITGDAFPPPQFNDWNDQLRGVLNNV